MRSQFWATTLIDRVQLEFDRVGIVDPLGFWANFGFLRGFFSCAGLHGVEELSCQRCAFIAFRGCFAVWCSKMLRNSFRAILSFWVACRDVVIFSSCWPHCA